MGSGDIAAGAVFSVTYPYIREDYTEWSEDGPCTTKTWRPGVRHENISQYEEGTFADGIGKAHFTVVSIHKPGRFPTRVFFTRQWEDPDGRRFGKGKLRMTTAPAFRRLIAGYREAFAVDPTPPPASEGESR